MKILYVSDDLSSIHEYRLIKKIAAKFEVLLVSFMHACQIPERINQISGIRIFHFPIKEFLFESRDNLFVKINKKIKNKFEFFKKYAYFKNLLREAKPDVIHAGWVQNSGYLAALSKFHPFLLMPWGSDILMQPDFSKAQMKITKYTLSRADAIACDCENVKSKIIEISGYDGEKIEIFPWGVDLDRFNPQNRDENLRERLGWEDKKIIIVTRSFEKIYGLEYIIGAAPEVIKAVPDARFVFCGEGSEKQRMIAMADNMNLSEYIYFAGFIENNVLPHYLNIADIYVSSSLSDGTSVSLLEAMACAKPVVVTDVPSNYEWIKDGEGGFIVPRKDSKSLALKIIQLLKDDELRKRMQNVNLKIARQRADWDKNFKELEKVYERLAG